MASVSLQPRTIAPVFPPYEGGAHRFVNAMLRFTAAVLNLFAGLMERVHRSDLVVVPVAQIPAPPIPARPRLDDDGWREIIEPKSRNIPSPWIEERLFRHEMLDQALTPLPAAAYFRPVATPQHAQQQSSGTPSRAPRSSRGFNGNPIPSPNRPSRGVRA